ncbi:glycine receptor subunit alpha-4-like protein [Dinothrombium tinctorium]|uniref:Glycine receptor subunit alpha-4-like protein n=1 Tax=Dinothrombium tinctorium TaxID=1965070 RepID=A0A3S3SJ47_9ACAR|nr:glycine receptor subunit alpha-4-like protein [Dinothrombium tinctorium]
MVNSSVNEIRRFCSAKNACKQSDKQASPSPSSQADTDFDFSNDEDARNKEHESKVGQMNDADKSRNSTLNETTSDETPVIKVIPKAEKDLPLAISVDFYIEDINSFSEQNMDFRLDYYMVQNWEAQLKFCEIDKVLEKGYKKENGSGRLTIPEDAFGNFWMPDTIIANSKSSDLQSQIVKTKTLLRESIIAKKNNSSEVEAKQHSRKLPVHKISRRFYGN